MYTIHAILKSGLQRKALKDLYISGRPPISYSPLACMTESSLIREMEIADQKIRLWIKYKGQGIERKRELDLFRDMEESCRWKCV